MTIREHPDRQPRPPLLGAGDPPPVAILNPAGSSPFLLTGDHAGAAVPRSLDPFGLSEAERGRHIAIDIGVRAVGELLSARLDAMFLHQHYSRLVIDCNRDPATADAMPAVSDGTIIPANRALSADDRAARIAAIHTPYHAAIAAELDRRAAAGLPAIFVALHSFTPVMAGIARPWDIGILHQSGDPRFAIATLRALESQGGFLAADNEPYHMDDTDFSVPRHAWPRGLPYVEVEFRQDHLAANPDLWADRFARALLAAHAAVQVPGLATAGSTP